MRVLVLTQGFPRHPDDHHAPFVLDHARALVAAGLEVTVLCPSAPGLAARERWGSVEVVRFRYAPRRFETLAYTGAMHHRARGRAALLVLPFMVGFVAAAWRESRRAQVVHGHWWVPSGLVAVLAARLTGAVAVVQLHGTDAAMAVGPVRWLAKWTLRQASAVVAVSSDLAAWCSRVSGREAAVLPMPLVNERLGEPTPPPAGGPVVAVGRLVPEKGFDVLIRAAAQTGDRVVIAGDGPERANLAELAVALGADVELLGAVPPAAVRDLYQAARVVVVPSRREGFGLVAAEAAAAGRVVIASHVGGLPDVVQDGANGVLVPADDVEALAAALTADVPTLWVQGPAAVRHLGPGEIGRRSAELYRAAPPAASLQPLVRKVGGVVAFVCVGLLLLSLRRQWDETARLDLEWRPTLLVAAVASVAVAGALLSWSWGWLVRAAGETLPPALGLRLWWSGQLGRYLPTGLGSAPARVVLAARSGVSRSVAVRTTAAEPVVTLALCAGGASLALGTPLGVIALAAAALVAALGASKLVRVSRAVAAGYVGMLVAQVALRGIALWLCLRLFGADVGRVDAVGAACLGYALGFLAVFAPGGVGVREAAIGGSLAAAAGAAPAVGAAVVLRLLEVVVELGFLAITRLIRLPNAATTPATTV